MGDKLETCVVCLIGPREVPDREDKENSNPMVCRKCHGARLLGDLRRIMGKVEEKDGNR